MVKKLSLLGVNKPKKIFESIWNLGFVQAFSKNATLQKVSASVFGFLDKKNDPNGVTFPQLIMRLYPSLTKDQLIQVIEWTFDPLGNSKEAEG